MNRLNRQMGSALLVLLLCSAVWSQNDAGPKKQKKPSTFDTLIDQLIDQVDKQMTDRNSQIAKLDELYTEINRIEQVNLTEMTSRARMAAISREAMITTDEMIRDPKNIARVSELGAFLRRSITRDQELFDKSLRRSESLRFEYDRQIAKIKSEQTVLKNIRRDLESLKKFPTGKERASFFLNTVKSLLDGLSSATGS